MPKFRHLDSLSYDDALDELAGLMDAKSEATDPVDAHHWVQDFSARVQDLEVHLYNHRPKALAASPQPMVDLSQPLYAADDLGPLADPLPVDPRCLPAPTVPPAPRPIAERIQTRMSAYLTLLERLKENPYDQRIRNNAKTTLSQINALGRQEGIKVVLPPVPPPMGRKPKVDVGAEPRMAPEPIPTPPSSMVQGLQALLAAKVAEPEVTTHRIEPEDEPEDEPEVLPVPRDASAACPAIKTLPPEIQAALDRLTAEDAVQTITDRMKEGPCPSADPNPLPAVRRSIVKLVIAKDGSDCEVILDDGSVLIGLTAIEGSANIKELASFHLMGRLA